VSKESEGSCFLLEKAVDKVLLLTADVLGQGDEVLGRLLMKNYLIVLKEGDNKPDVILLINRGVLLAVAGTASAEVLEMLAASDVKVLSCGTCVDYYQVKDKLAVGEVTNMYTIRDYLDQGNKVITL
jgi:selenium metabolism protein YedF